MVLLVEVERELFAQPLVVWTYLLESLDISVQCILLLKCVYSHRVGRALVDADFATLLSRRKVSLVYCGPSPVVLALSAASLCLFVIDFVVVAVEIAVAVVGVAAGQPDRSLRTS